MKVLPLRDNDSTGHRPLFARGILLCALAFFQVTQAQTPRPGAAPDVKTAILGTWEGFMADSDGSRHGDIKLEITENNITASNPRGGQTMGAGTYKISSSTGQIKHMDAKGTSGQFSGKSYEGILSIEGDTLKWCSANDNPRSKRPTALKTNVQAGQFLMILERKKS